MTASSFAGSGAFSGAGAGAGASAFVSAAAGAFSGSGAAAFVAQLTANARTTNAQMIEINVFFIPLHLFYAIEITILIF
jgi:hypothetical protein